MEIPLKFKYRRPGRGHQQHKGGHNNQGSSAGKHAAHPQVHGFVRNHYHCEPKWNPKETS
jgi:hypothetical protein